MDWAGIQEHLERQIGLIASDEIDPVETFWEDRKSAWRSDVRIKLMVLASRKIGRDEVRYTHDPVADRLNVLHYGNRTLTVQIKAETRSQDLARSAWPLIENIRTRLDFQETRDEIAKAGLGISTWSSPRVFQIFDAQDRSVSVAIMDVTFLTHTGDAAQAIDYIATVRARLLVKDCTGATVLDDTQDYPL